MGHGYISIIWISTILGAVVSAEGFLWIGSSAPTRKTSSERNQPAQYAPNPYFLRGDGTPWTPQYTYDNPVPPMTVALPVAVPFTAQMSPPGLKPQPVQLVPCLCPITRDDGQQQVQQTQQQPYVVQQQPQQQSNTQT